MNKKHKHYDAIIAFANGAQIEGRPTPNSAWNLFPNPSWENDWEYRIKPEDPIYGKPLSEGEKELIKAIRNAGIDKVYECGNTMLVRNESDGLASTRMHIAFLTLATTSKDEAIVKALKKIQEELEVSNGNA